MICTEEDGMKRVLIKVLLPGLVIAVWMNTCFYVCRSGQGFDFFLYWLIVGFPFGIRKMCMVLVSRNFGLGTRLAIFALNGIIGGLIGGMVVIFRIFGIIGEILSIIAGNFWTKSPEVE